MEIVRRGLDVALLASFQKYFSRIIILATIVTTALAMGGCVDNEARMVLKQDLYNFNQQCPINYDGFSTLKSAKLEDNKVVFCYLINEKKVNDEQINALFNTLSSVPYDYFIVKIYEMKAERRKHVLNLVVDADCGIELVFTGAKTSNGFSCLLSNDELRFMVSNYYTDDDYLNSLIKIQNKLFYPVRSEDGLIVEKIELTATSVRYIVIANENSINLAQLQGNLDEVKNFIRVELEKASAPNTDDYMFMKKIRSTGRGIIYVYRGDKTRKEVPIEFSNEELKQIANE